MTKSDAQNKIVDEVVEILSALTPEEREQPLKAYLCGSITGILKIRSVDTVNVDGKTFLRVQPEF